jgi:hypothetical protein
MGLTIYYTLSTREALSDSDAKKLVTSAHVSASASAVEEVSELVVVEPDFPLAHEFLPTEAPDGGQTYVDVPPDHGYVFIVTLGKDCESLLLGLCRFPAFVEFGGRQLPTKVGQGWRLRLFCKTQYASLHGWEHFLRCHRTAIDLLNSWRKLGIEVQISDEGGYWPHNSEGALRRNLDELNGICAAMAGTLKDSDVTSQNPTPVEAPIFGHPEFERLEAEGMARHGAKVRHGAKIASQLGPPS